MSYDHVEGFVHSNYKKVHIVRVFIKELPDGTWGVFGNSGTKAPENSAIGWWVTENEYLLTVHSLHDDAAKRRLRYHDRLHNTGKLRPFVRTVRFDLPDYLLQ